MVRISMELGGVKEVSQALTICIRNSTDLRPAFKTIIKKMEKLQKEMFAKGGAAKAKDEVKLRGGLIGPPAPPVYYQPWEKLKRATIKGKIRDGYGSVATKPLIRRGKIMRAFINSSDANAVRTIAKRSLTYGINESKLDYGVYHQSDRPRYKLPQRRMLRVSNALRKQFANIITAHVLKTQRGTPSTLFDRFFR